MFVHTSLIFLNYFSPCVYWIDLIFWSEVLSVWVVHFSTFCLLKSGHLCPMDTFILYVSSKFSFLAQISPQKYQMVAPLLKRRWNIFVGVFFSNTYTRYLWHMLSLTLFIGFSYPGEWWQACCQFFNYPFITALPNFDSCQPLDNRDVVLLWIHGFLWVKSCWNTFPYEPIR